MGQFLTLTSRNLKLYFRDKSAIFFSLLSMIIVIILMVLFLADMNVNSITEMLGQFPNRDNKIDEQNAKLFVYAWTCAGILSINTITINLSIYSNMIKDKISGKLNSFYTAPISKIMITSSYIATAWIASVIVCIFTFLLTELYGVIQGLEWYSLREHAIFILKISVNACLYATMLYFVAMLAKTEGAWSGIGTVIGTLVGFLGGIYIPIGTLSSTIQSLLKCTPILYSTVWIRNSMVENILNRTFTQVPKEYIVKYREMMGMDINVWEYAIDNTEIVLFLLVMIVIFIGIDVCMLNHSKKADR